MINLRERIERELLEGLNDVQRAAVLHAEGPLLILAGAGSGKTRVITHRISHLCRVRSVYPYRIVAVTFTNKAAREMQIRLEGLLGPMAGEVMVKTFHSLGLYIVRRNYEKLGLKSGFSIYDAQAQESLLKRILKDLHIDPDTATPGSAGAEINRARDALISVEDFAEQNDFYARRLAGVYKEYIKRLRANNAIDFGDLLFESVRLFEKFPEVLEEYQRIWTHLHIDEYQDTNKAQYRMSALLSGKHRNIVVVGDDDQSIYSWRGADITNILNFEKEYPDAKVLHLMENYRSTPEILKLASAVIQHNGGRREKELWTQAPPGDPVRFYLYRSESGEAGGDQGEVRGVVSKIRTFRSRGISYSSIAVFYRTNAQSRLFEEALRREGIPYIVIGGVRFYERREIKDILAYLNVIINPDDREALLRIINVPARGAGDVGVAKLENWASSRGMRLSDALGHAGEVGGIRAAGALKKLADLFENWRRRVQAGDSPAEIVEAVIDESGYLDSLRREGDPESESRVENLLEFLGSVKEYRDQEGGTLDEFLQSLSLLTAETDPDGQTTTDRVSLLTLHNAKGLEYDVVFITGVEEGFLPHSLSIDEGNIEEERRLMYVGITRAKQHLELSAVRYRRVFGTFQPRMSSRFLDEMRPAGLVMENSEGRPDAAPRASYGAGRNPVPPSVRRPSRRYMAGSRVQHDRYGDGTVVQVEETPSGQKLTIAFDGEERHRSFLTDYAPLVPLS